MALGFYFAMFGISIVMTIVYAIIFHKHFDANLTIVNVLIPIINFGFVLMALAKSPEEAIISLRLTYLGGCFLIVAVMFLIFNTCGIKLHPWFRSTCITVSSIVFVTTYRGPATLSNSSRGRLPPSLRGF